MRTVFMMAVFGAFALLGSGSVRVLADEKPAPPTREEMEKLSGKDLYKLTCKPCHGTASPAGEYTPMTLIQEQWEAFFDRKYAATHDALADSAAADSLQAAPATEWITPELLGPIRLLTPGMIEKIRKFTIDGAADSEHPMTCG